LTAQIVKCRKNYDKGWTCEVCFQESCQNDSALCCY